MQEVKTIFVGLVSVLLMEIIFPEQLSLLRILRGMV